MPTHAIQSSVLRCLLLLAAASPAAVAAPPLPALAAEVGAVTVSGISSGGYMAVQFQVAHSKLVRGAGIIAGGPYYCAQGSTWRALQHCLSPSDWTPLPPLTQTEATLDTLAKSGRIDPLEHLRDDRVWLLSGGADKTVERPVMDRLEAFYRARLPAAAIRYVKPADAGHAMPSAVDSAANDCPTSAPPFINRCRDPDGAGDLDAAGEILAHLLDTTVAAATPPRGAIVAFDQRPYVAGKTIDASLAEAGYVYLPPGCGAGGSGGCRVHVAFHGCRQSDAQIGRRFVDGAGYNRWADAYRLIILYPQTVPRDGIAAGSWRWVYNPKGCWDWWGYTGSDYHTRDGVQIRAIKAMIERLGAPRPH